MTAAAEPSCKEVVELVTDYLEGRMPPAERALFDQHISHCAGCATYLEQMRQTIAAAGRAREGSLDPKAREELVRAFRGWKGKK